MLLKTQGIVLHTLKYTDKKVISKIYTRHFGLQSYMITTGSGSKSKIKPALLTPLTQLELEIFAKQNKDLGRITELRCFYQYSELQLNIPKNAVASFLNEILYRCIHEHEANEELFQFIVHSFQWLDTANESVNNFHLYFLAELSKHFGFYPNNNYNQIDCFFDLLEGVFASAIPKHPHYLDKNESKDFSSVYDFSLNTYKDAILTKQQRNNLLYNFIRYFQLHLPGLKEIKSLGVLQATFN